MDDYSQDEIVAELKRVSRGKNAPLHLDPP
jgi:hypothetical protein